MNVGLHKGKSWYVMLVLCLTIMILGACAAADEEGKEPSGMNPVEGTQDANAADEPDKPDAGVAPSDTDDSDKPEQAEDDIVEGTPLGNGSDGAADNGEPSGGEDPRDLPQQETDDPLEEIREQYDYTNPASIAVLVNKTYGLPEGYEPDDLIKPDVPFVYQDESVHSLREVAAEALIDMFEASKADGLEMAAVSGYRSYAIQKMLYEKYVARDGEEAASKYSAKPGHSEHSTGLAIDVAGISGRCAANNCFAGTDEAIWLAEHAHEFGFIIRYPSGKEEITGYQYEPWHLRYVGVELAGILYENDWTMEEFFLGEEEVIAGNFAAES